MVGKRRKVNVSLSFQWVSDAAAFTTPFLLLQVLVKWLVSILAQVL